MSSFSTLEPVILNQESFTIERVLPQGGDVLVTAGQPVTPEEVIARSEDVEQTLTLYAASELGVDSSELSKYVTKSIGSTISKGEAIARMRRGLRTAAVKSPANGRLISIDDKTGTVALTSSMGRRELLSLVNGEVEQVIRDRGAVIRTSGTKLYGIAGFGTEAIGTLVLGSDRPDRELTVDHVSDEWRGSIVLAGMTAGVPALIRLHEVGAAAVVLGSMPEGNLRRFLSGGQVGREEFWNPVTARNGDPSHQGVESPLVILLTEGFGRHPMSSRIYELLKSRAGQSISVNASASLGDRLVRPEIYLSDDEGANACIDEQIEDSRPVRVVDAGAPAGAGTVIGSPYVMPNRYGVRRVSVDVMLDSGQIRSVPLPNIEIVE